MATLTDPDRLSAYKDALSNWEFEGYVTFQLTAVSAKWIQNELGISHRDLKQRMYEHVASGGEVDEVIEKRENWLEQYQFHYDLRFKVEGTAVYVETRLKHKLPLKPDESTILVVSVHAP